MCNNFYLQIERKMVKEKRELNGTGLSSGVCELLEELKIEPGSAEAQPSMRKWPSPVFDQVSKFMATVTYLDDEGQIYLQTEHQVGALDEILFPYILFLTCPCCVPNFDASHYE